MRNRIVGRAGTLVLAGSLLAAIVAAVTWWQVRAQAAEASMFPQGSYAYLADEPDVLFLASGPQAASTRPGVPAVSGGHPIRISRDAARKAVERGSVSVVLPDNTRYDVRFEREELASTGDWTFIGRVRTPFDELASVLTFGPDGVFGTLPAPDGRMFHITTSHGVSSIAPAGDVVPPGQDATAAGAQDFVPVSSGQEGKSHPAAAAARAGMVPHAGAPAPPKARVFPDAPADDLAEVDVLGVYTSDLVALRGSASAVETEFANLLAVANQAYIDSGTVVRLRLVGLRETGYPPDRDNHRALEEMTSNDLPDGLDVHAVRLEVQADLVAMLRPLQEGSSTCGVGWLNGGQLMPETAVSDFGYSVNSVAPCGPLVLAHEIGHNLGSMHDFNASMSFDGVQYGAFPFSFGFRRPDPGGFATVMAYTSGEPWIGRFSDPLATACAGLDCGTAEADNVRSLARMAATIANFATAPGTLSILDAFSLEDDEASDYSDVLVFRLRLSTPAPAGGVSFDISTRDGSAIAGADYVAGAERMSIPHGAMQADWQVPVVPDRSIEATETMEVVVSNVVGATAGDLVARGNIDDDDPRAYVRGKVLFPSGLAPDREVFLQVQGASQPMQNSFRVLHPPGFGFDVPVTQGAHLTLTVNPPAPFLPATFDLGIVSGDMSRDLEIDLPVRVSGRLRFPEGAAPPDIPVAVRASSVVGWANTIGTSQAAVPPDFEYELPVVPGAHVELSADPSAPYVRQLRRLGRVHASTTVDLEMRTVPGLLIYGSEIPEGDGSYVPGMGVAAFLSAPAGEGGVSYDVEVVDGTATAGADYTGSGGSHVIAEGDDVGPAADVSVLGDLVPEEDESVFAKVSNVVGAWAPQPLSEPMWIYNDDPRHEVGNDVNGDGYSEMFWRSSNVVTWWLMNGAGTSRSKSTTKPGTQHLVAMPNFYGDSFHDLLWFDEADGTFWLWQSTYDEYAKDPLDWTLPGAGWRVLGSLDVDGDRRGDLLLRDPATGTFQWWLVDGRQVATTHSLQVPSRWRLAATGDLDADGHGDLVWRDPGEHRLVLWEGQADGTFGTGREIAGYPGGDWLLVGAVDIDGDGHDDLLWHSAATQSIAWWRMQGPDRIASGNRPLPAGFQLVGTDDYNGDGRADLRWFDPDAREAWAWLSANDGWTMERIGPAPAGARPLVRPGFPEAVTGDGGRGGALHLGDADGDGRTDLLWHSAAQASLDAWSMRGNRRASVVQASAPAGGVVLATADLDGDGFADMVVADREARTVSAMLDRGHAGVGYVQAPIGVLPGDAWALVATGDLDGSGSDELLWYHATSGRASVWWMDGAAVVRRDLWQLPADQRPLALASFDGAGNAGLATQDRAGDIRFHWVEDHHLGRSRVVGGLPGPGWMVADVVDVDGDGNADIVLHEPATGQAVVRHMDGAIRLGEAALALPPGYHLAGIGDFDGDGKAGLLAHDPRREELWLWRATDAGWTRQWAGAYPREPVVHPTAIAR